MDLSFLRMVVNYTHISALRENTVLPSLHWNDSVCGITPYLSVSVLSQLLILPVDLV